MEGRTLYEFTTQFSRQLLLATIGNSGTILSQIFKGFFEPITPEMKEINVNTLIEAFSFACKIAYKVVPDPKEGTMLTVIRVVSEHLNKNSKNYNTIEEVTYTMYSEDGRSLRVFKDEGELYRKVGWFYNLEDVSVKMYDTEGNEHLVFNANIEEAKKNGLTPHRFEVQQLMFAADGRIIYVPFELAEAYEKVGWYRGGGKLDPTRPMVALTFDDGPGRYTDRVLNCLEKYGVRATFFVQGKNVAGYASTLKRAVDLGCEIGNHTKAYNKCEQTT